MSVAIQTGVNQPANTVPWPICLIDPYNPGCNTVPAQVGAAKQGVQAAGNAVNTVAGDVNSVSAFFSWIQTNAARVGLFIVALMLVAIGLVVFSQGN